MSLRHGGLIAALVAAIGLLPAAHPAGDDPFDLAILNGLVVDGTGAAAVRADVGVRGGRIARVGRIDPADARDILEAAGLVVAPGFIDVHTHADRLADSPRAVNFVRMGVTSIVAGNCGASAVDVGAALAEIERVGASVNFATLVGHNSVRREVMGTGRRDPTPAEMRRMKALVWRAMADGAVGFSTGLQYVPGTYAAVPEIVQLATVAAQAGGLYASHMRSEGTALEESIRETIAVGEAAGCPVQISHLKVDSPSRWGASAAALGLIDAARERGVRVAADQYAYTAASSTLSIRFPSWALEGGRQQVAARLDEEETWTRIREEMLAMLRERGLEDLSFAVVASYPADPSLNGLAMPEVAGRLTGDRSAGGQLEAARRMLRAGGATMVYHFMADEDVERIMRHPAVGFASDSSVLAHGEGVPHPRGYGNTVRVLGLYVREKRVIALEEAVRRMTSLPAEHFRLKDRGRLADGLAADLVLFDPAVVADRATFAEPHQYPAGVPHVLVNGVPVVRDGVHTGARPGQVLRP